MNRHATTRTYRSSRKGFFLTLLLLMVNQADILHAGPAQDCAGYYPVYSGSKLTVDKKGVTVNGNLVDKTKGSDYNSISANGLLQNVTLPPPPLPAITPGSFPPNTSNVKIEDAVTVSAGF